MAEHKSITITTRHAASSYGIPVCLVDGQRTDDKDGLRACMAALGWDRDDLGYHINKSNAAVQSYLYQGRPVPAEVWNVLRDALEAKGA